MKFSEIGVKTPKEIDEALGKRPIFSSSQTTFDDNQNGRAPALSVYRNVGIDLHTATAYCGKEAIDLSDLTLETQDALREKIEILEGAMKSEYDDLFRLADELAVAQLQRRCLAAVVAYKNWTPLAYNNVWVRTEDRLFTSWVRSNMVYHCRFELQKNAVDGKFVVRYVLRFQAVMGEEPDHIKENFKKFTKEDDAMKYLEGRMNAFDKKYFNELCPPIPAEYAREFTWAGMILPGYRIEGEAVPRCFRRKDDVKYQYQDNICAGRQCEVCKGCALRYDAEKELFYV